MSVEEPEDAEVVGSEIVPVERAQQPANLFHTNDPVEVVEKASKVADALKGVIDRQKLSQRIQGREHVLVEGWTTLGSMLGVVPVVLWSRRIEPPTKYTAEVVHYEWVQGDNARKVKREKGRTTYEVDGYDWEARVEVRTIDGRTVGAAEALCSRKEHSWSKRDDYALRSMAQTRATSKALRGPLGFVVTLAGYAETPAEETEREDVTGTPPQDPKHHVSAETAQASEKAATAKQRGLINARATEKGLPPSTLANIVLVAASQEPRDFESQTDAEGWLRRQLDRLPGRLVDTVLVGIAEAKAEQ